MPRPPYVATPPPPRRRSLLQRVGRGRLLAALLALTVALLVTDLAGGVTSSRVRAGGAAVFGPLQRLVGPDPRAELSRVTAERDALAQRDRTDHQALAEAKESARLLESPALTGARLVPARVVAVGAVGAAGPERVTIDVGTRDGVRRDLSVVTADGLVGRVVSVAPWTSDVLVIGARDLTVGVRVGDDGRLGAVSGAGAPGAAPRSAGQLNLTLVQQGALRPGDRITTLGSVDNRPFVPGVPVGTVLAVDGDQGRLAPSGAVRPAVDTGALHVVGVLLSGPRTTPRVSVTTGQP
ncbi:MAG: rod shape-determining protein MreC [Micrococcales bacterium]|nr:rod shape-determining protein MreC [Micrococcales bacterium]